MKTGHFCRMVAYYRMIEMGMADYFDNVHVMVMGQGFVCIRPFRAGLLIDRRAGSPQLQEDDRNQDGQWDEAYDRFELVKTTFGNEVESWSTFAMKFALIHPVVTSLLIASRPVSILTTTLETIHAQLLSVPVVGYCFLLEHMQSGKCFQRRQGVDIYLFQFIDYRVVLGYE